MGLESGTYINSLNASNPVGATDQKSQGDDHIRLLKSTILNTFPNIDGAMNATEDELNLLVGITALASTYEVLDNFPSGTLMLFQQTAAPTGYTKQVTHNDKALRVVTGTVGTGGTDAFTTTFSASKATESYALTDADIPEHTHTLSGTSQTTAAGSLGYRITSLNTSTKVDSGGASGHTHDITLDLQYVDVIIASKD